MDEKYDWHLTGDIRHESGRGDPFAAAVRATRMPMVITDPRRDDNPIVFCNEAFQKLTGYTREEIIGRNCRFLQGPNTDRAQVARIRAAVESGVDIDVDLLNYRKDGSTFWNALYLSPVKSASGEIQFFFASQLDVTERVEAQEAVAQQKEMIEREVERRTLELKDALESKTLLLHEVDHRVKNNLTMIGSLVRLQARTIKDRKIVDKLHEIMERIDALATVHRRLYETEDVTKFDIGAFLVTLASDVVGASGRSNLKVDIQSEEINVPAKSASALGLALNEILTNAIKHGFRDGRSGVLTIIARKVGQEALLEIADDGPGLAQDARGKGLGLVLIERLSRQVGATASWSTEGPGASVAIRFPLQAE